MSTSSLCQAKQSNSDWLAVFVANADDAMIGIDLNGAIASWNPAAERLFGYSEAEALGAPATMIGHDNSEAVRCLQRDERIEPRRATYRRKDSSTVEVSVAVSAIRCSRGDVVGVAMVARDISTEMRAQEETALLIADMHHRIRNLFTLAASVVALSSRFASTPAALARHVRSRLVALSRANDLTLSAFSHDHNVKDREVDLASLIGSVVASYGEPASIDGAERIMVSGPEMPVSGSSVTHFALLLNELATNAAKYGALSQPGGTITVECSAGPSDLCVLWREQGGPALDGVDPAEGFGGQFTRTVIARHLGGTITRKWTRDGLIVRLDVPLANLRR